MILGIETNKRDCVHGKTISYLISVFRYQSPAACTNCHFCVHAWYVRVGSRGWGRLASQQRSGYSIVPDYARGWAVERQCSRDTPTGLARWCRHDYRTCSQHAAYDISARSVCHVYMHWRVPGFQIGRLLNGVYHKMKYTTHWNLAWQERGTENAGVKKSGADRRSEKCRSRKWGVGSRVWGMKMQEWKNREHFYCVRWGVKLYSLPAL